MALQAPVKRALTCSNCRKWIVGSFIAAIGVQTTSRAGRYRTPLQQRRVLSRTARRSDENQRRSDDEALPLNDINASAVEQNTPKPASTATQPPQPIQDDAHLPWYLRLQSPLPEQPSPISSRQVLPELPSDPPPLLQPLLEHISVQLGMDSLTLLDLRALDPPPALGANLLMLIGTARSERHLHVSSDKLCRWLRTEWRLAPHADGLLGRGELKILMRRKAKRRRLLSAVNAGKGVGVEGTGEGDVEDGVRTGWVCVNIGTVEGGGGQARETIPSEGVIGFGPAVEGGGGGGCSIVVQLMTEEKRAEVDLETLWEGILAKAERERERLREHVGMGGAEGAEEAVVVQDENGVQVPEQKLGSTSRGLENAMPAVSNQSSTQQMRAYHTTTRRPAPMSMSAAKAVPNIDLEAQNDETPLPSPSALAAAVETTSGESSDPSLSLLNEMLATLKSLPRKEALEALGPNVLQASEHLCVVPSIMPAQALDNSKNKVTPLTATNPETITMPFVEEFYGAMPPFPTAAHWHTHISLLAHARTFGHPALHSPVLVAQIKNMLIAGLIPEERTFLLVVRSMLSPLGAREGVVGDEARVSNNKRRDVLGLLEEMEGCGYECLSGEVLAVLERGFGARERGGMGDQLDFNSLLRTIELARLRRLANTRDWPAFWRTWRSYPQRFLPRSSEMYTILFDAVADGKLVATVPTVPTVPTEESEMSPREKVVAMREAKEVVWACLEEMEMEEPVVCVEGDFEGKLARAVRGAVGWCEPGLASREGEAKGVERGWREWWERCTRALEGSRGEA